MRRWQIISNFWRIRLLLAGVLVVVSLVVARLADLQISQHHRLSVAAEENSDYVFSIPATRGVLLDRYGDPLVKNTIRYWRRSNAETLFPEEQEVEAQQALTMIATQSAIIRKEYSRWYPFEESGAHSLGYVGPIAEEELLGREAADIHDQVGRTGLERALETELRGQAGEREYEVTATGKTTRVVRERQMQPGKTIATTLDPYLTQISQQALVGLIGSVVIEDVQSGEILALVSSPTFDPNVFSARSTISIEEDQQRQRIVTELLNDPRKVLFNRAVAGTYPPGSIFKLVTALAGLESSEIDQSFTVVDEGVLKVGEYEYANWYFSQYGQTEGEIGLVRALARSNDIYFYKVAEHTGPDDLAGWARTLGLGTETGLELEGEAAGLVPDPAWKEQTLHEQWYLGNTYHFGIGQGDVLVTPIQISQLAQIVGNQGVRCQPHLIDQIQSSCASVGLTESNVDLVLEGMLGACSTGGTAFPFFSYNQQFESVIQSQSPLQAITAGAAACKTGTAEFGPADERGLRKTHAWFTVIVGIPDLADQPESQEQNAARSEWYQRLETNPLPKRIAITVLVESDEVKPFREGSADAAPVALSIFEQIRGKR